MSKFVVKNRRITVEQELYTYSIAEDAEGIQLLLYRDRRPMVRLRQNWTEAWGINLYRPGVVAQVIRYYWQKGAQTEPQFLYREPELFSKLTDLCFSAEEQAEKEHFLQICARTRAWLESKNPDKIKRSTTV